MRYNKINDKKNIYIARNNTRKKKTITQKWRI